MRISNQIKKEQLIYCMIFFNKIILIIEYLYKHYHIYMINIYEECIYTPLFNYKINKLSYDVSNNYLKSLIIYLYSHIKNEFRVSDVSLTIIIFLIHYIRINMY